MQNGVHYLNASFFTIEAASPRLTVSLSSSFPDMPILGFPGKCVGRLSRFIGRKGVMTGAGKPRILRGCVWSCRLEKFLHYYGLRGSSDTAAELATTGKEQFMRELRLCGLL
jgi:hypothetical protein